MTPDEIEKDRAPERIWIDDARTYSATFFSAGIPYVRADLFDALTAENAALKARMAELEAALHPFSKTAGEMFSRNWEKDDVALKFVTKGKAFIVTFSDFLNARAALEKSHE